MEQLGLGALKLLQLLVDFGESSFQRGAAILCGAQQGFRTVKLGVVAG